jgi:prefoldin subunit 5
MTEQQEHLSQLLEQQQQILANLNALNNQMTAGREALLRVQGAINYLQEVGVTLPEPEVEEEVAEEAAE